MNAEQRKMLEEITCILRSGVWGSRPFEQHAKLVEELLAPPSVIRDARELVEGGWYVVKPLDTGNAERTVLWRCLIDGRRGQLSLPGVMLCSWDDDRDYFTGRYEAIEVKLPEWPDKQQKRGV